MKNRALSSFAIFASSALASLSVNAQTYDQDSAVETGGFGKWLIDSLFEAGDITSIPADPGIIGSVIAPFSLACMVVAALIIVVKSVQHVMVVAQAKDPESSPIAMTWAPIHLVLAVVLIMPTPSGYSVGQYWAIWLAQQSNFLGNITASKANPSNYGVITQMPLPGSRDMIEAIIDAQLCRDIYNKTADYVASQNGSRTFVEPRRLTKSQLEQVSGFGGQSSLYSQNNTISRHGVTFDRYKEGGFLNSAGGTPYCGGVFVEFTTDTKNYWSETEPYLSKGAPVSLDRGTNNLNTSNLEECKYGAMCVGEKDLTGLDTRKKIAQQVFSVAHNKAASVFLDEAMRPSATQLTAVDALTYDVDEYFDGMGDLASLRLYMDAQAEEDKKINQAVDASFKLLRDTQSSIYKKYSTAINEFGTTRNAAGDNFGDIIDKVGWPVLGLYWFQNSTFNSKVMEAVKFRASSTVYLDAAIQNMAATMNDPLFSERMAMRLKEYKSRLAAKIKNTGLDPNPTGRSPSLGSISSGANSSFQSVFDSGAAYSNAKSAAEIKDEFPRFTKELITAAANGVISSDDGVIQQIEEFNKTTIFPFILRPLRHENLLTGLVNTGHNIIVASEIVYIAKHVAQNLGKELQKRGLTGNSDKSSSAERSRDTSGSLNPFSWALGKAKDAVVGTVVGLLKTPITMAMDIINYFATMWFFVFLLGIFLAFYLPAMIMIQWLVAVVTWMIYVLEATIIIPLWGVLFTSHMGEKAFAPQIASQGFIHLLSILIYPSLLVIGFIVGLKVVDVASMFIMDFLIVGFLSATDGYVFGIVSLVAGLFVVSIAVYQILMRIFSLMLEFNDRAISWIGSRQTYGEGNVESQVRGGVTAVIGKVEMQGRGLGRSMSRGMDKK